MIIGPSTTSVNANREFKKVNWLLARVVGLSRRYCSRTLKIRLKTVHDHLKLSEQRSIENYTDEVDLIGGEPFAIQLRKHPSQKALLYLPDA